jgi:integrase
LHLREFYVWVRASGASPNTLANFDRTLRAIFARIEREGREDFDLPDNWKSPLAVVEKHRSQKLPKQPLSGEEAKQLLRAARRKGFIAYRNFAELAFMLMSGARSIEVLNLRLVNIDLERRIADLRVTKGSKPRIVFLPTRLVRILANYLRRRDRTVSVASDLFFPTRDGRMQTRRALHRSVGRAGLRIAVSDLGPHRLRHSYVTLSHAKGAPLKFLQEQCGHSSVLVTQGYITLSEAQKSELADRYVGW